MNLKAIVQSIEAVRPTAFPDYLIQAPDAPGTILTINLTPEARARRLKYPPNSCLASPDMIDYIRHDPAIKRDASSVFDQVSFPDRVAGIRLFSTTDAEREAFLQELRSILPPERV